MGPQALIQFSIFCISELPPAPPDPASTASLGHSPLQPRAVEGSLRLAEPGCITAGAVVQVEANGVQTQALTAVCPEVKGRPHPKSSAKSLKDSVSRVLSECQRDRGLSGLSVARSLQGPSFKTKRCPGVHCGHWQTKSCWLLEMS